MVSSSVCDFTILEVVIEVQPYFLQTQPCNIPLRTGTLFNVQVCSNYIKLSVLYNSNDEKQSDLLVMISLLKF